MGKIFLDNLIKIFDKKGKNGKYIKEVRGKGLFIALEFQGDNMADKIAKKLL
jgi:acetylornithine/succinyldiaminopimelate/putrescine aminotransferase